MWLYDRPRFRIMAANPPSVELALVAMDQANPTAFMH